MRGITRALALGLALAFVATACGTRRNGDTVSDRSSVASRDEATARPLDVPVRAPDQGQDPDRDAGGQHALQREEPDDGKWDGFDVAIGREIAKAIFGEAEDVEKFIEWVPVVSATRIPAITDNKADIVIKTFTINDERKAQIDFSDVYFRTGQRILVKKDNTTIKEAADMAGKTICSQRGSTSEKNILTATNNAARPLLLDSYPACLLALQQGQADAVSTDETILFGLVKQDPNTKIVGKYFSRRALRHRREEVRRRRPHGLRRLHQPDDDHA